jgi:hypothetical protein
VLKLIKIRPIDKNDCLNRFRRIDCKAFVDASLLQTCEKEKLN